MSFSRCGLYPHVAMTLLASLMSSCLFQPFPSLLGRLGKTAWIPLSQFCWQPAMNFIPVLDPKPVYTRSPAPVSSDLGADAQESWLNVPLVGAVG